MREAIIAILRAASEPASTAQICSALTQRPSVATAPCRPASHEHVYRELSKLERAGLAVRAARCGRHVSWSLGDNRDRGSAGTTTEFCDAAESLQTSTPDTDTNDHGTLAALNASSRIAVRRSADTVTMTYGRPGLDRCRAVIGQHGYTTTLRVDLNYNALSADDIAAAESAIAEIACRMVRHAATLRQINRPLFDVEHVIDNLGQRA